MIVRQHSRLDGSNGRANEYGRETRTDPHNVFIEEFSVMNFASPKSATLTVL
jgi:hypothetical protein